MIFVIWFVIMADIAFTRKKEINKINALNIARI